MNQHVLFNDPQDGDRRGEIAIDTIVLARELDLPFFTSGCLVVFLDTSCPMDTQKHSVPYRRR
ncbi:hypothetical protein B0H13DRAFT_2210851 [Mycena leptocephala]|nr:hypothetical protein B0H13DRAFT_2210851 [Mycena leptocephala]